MEEKIYAGITLIMDFYINDTSRIDDTSAVPDGNGDLIREEL